MRFPGINENSQLKDNLGQEEHQENGASGFE